MKLLTLCLFCLLLLVSTTFSLAETVTLGQFPAPSPDGSKLAFSFRGDIWIVPITGGLARRLTVHAANESNPVWSPDGKELAFSSDRNGNEDIFVMTAEGAALEQLTYLSTADFICDWSPDGQQLIFSSKRDFAYPSQRLPSLYQIKRTGGTPTMLMSDFGDHGKISPDGQQVLFTRGRIDVFRKHYRGSMNTDIWRFDRQTGEYVPLTDFEGYDFFPLWSADGKTVYYVSHQDGTANIWQMNPDGTQKKQLTFHQDDGVYFANIAHQAPVIAYCRGFEIWTLNLNTGKYNQVKITVPSDPKINTVEWKTFTSNASEMAISLDEKYIASVIHGNIFISKNKTEGSKKAVRLTETAAREHHLAWLPGADSLLFASDQAGNDDIYLLVSDDPAEKNLYRALSHKIIQLTQDKAEETVPKASPDGKKIAFIRDNDLWVMNRDGKNAKRLLESWNEPDYEWSPDSKWFVYSQLDNEFNSDVFIMPATGGDAVNLTKHPDDDASPVWSDDGRKLGFTSRRYDDTFDVWFVFLRQEDHEKTAEQWEEEEEKQQAAKKDKKAKTDSTKKEKVEVQIDFKDIHQRLRRITSLPGSETELAISPDGKTFVFRCNTKGKNDLWSVQWDGKELKQLTDSDENPSQIQWSKDGKKIYYLKSGGTYVSIGETGQDKKSIGFQARLEIDHQAERQQMFHEAWRVLNQNFYDPNFHGVDWAAMRQKYGAVIEEIATSDDFYTAVRMMLGELNASHLGITPSSQSGGIETGMPGLRFDESYSGDGLKIVAIMPNGPCDQASVKVEPGEILTAVDEQKITGATNVFQLFNQKVGERVQLTLSKGKSSRTVIVRPISFNALMTLEYKRWVELKREIVNTHSQGKLGYVHIRGMGWDNLQQFQAELFSEAYGKEGLLIDVRFNGGGWITDYVLTMLQAKPHAYTIPRGGGKGYPQSRLPYYTWTRPIASLCNQYSFSNAEIFTHAVKVLKLGKVIGEPTPGAVISTGGTRLLDGSTFRIPFRGWYNLETGLNQENNGAIPDFIVNVQCGDEAANIDRQLERAVEVLQAEIKANR